VQPGLIASCLDLVQYMYITSNVQKKHVYPAMTRPGIEPGYSALILQHCDRSIGSRCTPSATGSYLLHCCSITGLRSADELAKETEKVIVILRCHDPAWIRTRSFFRNFTKQTLSNQSRCTPRATGSYFLRMCSIITGLKSAEDWGKKVYSLQMTQPGFEPGFSASI
jgi:hypothetical protein